MKIRIDKPFSKEVKFFHFVKYIEYCDYTLNIVYDNETKEEYFCPRGTRIRIV